MSAFQMNLSIDNEKSKRIEHVPISHLSLSRFNTRKTRKQEKVEALAQRIARNGFEITRAVWVYPGGRGYEVFAGGTRFEAANLAGVHLIPVVVHEGFTDEDISLQSCPQEVVYRRWVKPAPAQVVGDKPYIQALRL